MDKQFGDVLRMLADTGHADDDTLVLFLSEQGNSLPHGKWTCYDVGIRVAAIARWPGVIAPGTENRALVQYVDAAPTILLAAGADPATIDTGCPDAHGARGFDGRSFLDVLNGKSQSFREVIFAEHTARGINRGPEAYGTRAVRDSRYKLIVNLEPDEAFAGGDRRQGVRLVEAEGRGRGLLRQLTGSPLSSSAGDGVLRSGDRSLGADRPRRRASSRRHD